MADYRKAKIALEMNYPFWASLILRTPFVESKETPNMGTDGEKIFYNPEYVEHTTGPKLLGQTVHVLGHLAFQHVARKSSRDQECWDKAADYTINSIIAQEPLAKNGKKLIELPDGALHDQKYYGKSVEQVYSILLREKQQGGSSQKQKGQGQGQGQDSESDSDSDSDQDPQQGQGQGKPSNKQSKQQPSGKGGQQPSPQQGQQPQGQPKPNRGKDADDHSKWQEEGKQPSKGSGANGETPQQYDPQDWKERLNQAATFAKMQGRLPGALEFLIDDLVHPKLDWKTILANFVMTKVNSNYRYNPPNKKYLPYGIVMPSTYGEKLEGCLAIDDSGSMSDEVIRTIVSEVRGLLDTFTSYELHLFIADAAVHTYIVLTEYDNDLPKKTAGRGGTDFRPVFHEIQKRKLNPSFLVYATDAYGAFPDKHEVDYPVIWLLTPDAAQPPFGDIAHISRDEIAEISSKVAV